MAHFAQLNDSNVVISVNVIADADCLDDNGNESEAIGIAFCKSLWGSDTNWKQTSYNDNIRGTYANPGSTYNPSKDKFIPPSPYASWVLNSDDTWEPPYAAPEEDKYSWDESAYQADNTKGWIKDDFT